MDIEQLRLIMEMVGSAGQGAFIIALLWVGENIILAIVWIMFITWFGKTIIVPLIARVSFVSQIKEVMGFHGDLTSKEKKEILDTLAKARGET